MPSNPRSMRSGPDGTSRPEAVTGRPAGAAATPNRPRGVLVFAAKGSPCEDRRRESRRPGGVR
jgi:hypothetical protein